VCIARIQAQRQHDIEEERKQKAAKAAEVAAKRLAEKKEAEVLLRKGLQESEAKKQEALERLLVRARVGVLC
jgi:hypothetical protein